MRSVTAWLVPEASAPPRWPKTAEANHPGHVTQYQRMEGSTATLQKLKNAHSIPFYRNCECNNTYIQENWPQAYHMEVYTKDSKLKLLPIVFNPQSHTTEIICHYFYLLVGSQRTGNWTFLHYYGPVLVEARSVLTILQPHPHLQPRGVTNSHFSQPMHGQVTREIRNDSFRGCWRIWR